MLISRAAIVFEIECDRCGKRGPIRTSDMAAWTAAQKYGFFAVQKKADTYHACCLLCKVALERSRKTLRRKNTAAHNESSHGTNTPLKATLNRPVRATPEASEIPAPLAFEETVP